MFIKLEKVYLYLVLLFPSYAAPIDGNVGRFVSSNEGGLHPTASPSKETHRYFAVNGTPPPNPNTTLFPSHNPILSHPTNLTLFPVNYNTSERDPLQLKNDSSSATMSSRGAGDFPVADFPAAGVSSRKASNPHGSVESRRIRRRSDYPHSSVYYNRGTRQPYNRVPHSSRHHGSVSSNRRLSHQYSSTGLMAPYGPRMMWPDFNAAAADAASSWKVNKHIKNEHSEVKTHTLAQPTSTLSFPEQISWYFTSIRDELCKVWQSVRRPLSIHTDAVVETVQLVPAGGSGRQISAGCGVPLVLSRSRRIVNGTVARPGQWPWMVNVARRDASGYTNICGGSLITERHVVTAAHCTYEITSNWSIVLGGTSRELNIEEINVIMIREIRSIRRHDRNSFTPFANDIAIIEMEYPVTFTDFIQPICLPNHSSDFVGLQGMILGWGKLYEDADEFSSSLRQADVPIRSRETCLEWYSRVGFMPVLRPEFMCAGHEHGGKDACGGDSGGPLMVQDEWGRWVLAGIVSHGYGCAEPYQPGIYINVSYYLPWIQQHLAT